LLISCSLAKRISNLKTGVMGKSKLLESIRTEIRRRNYSYNTEKSYCSWVVQFVRYHDLKHPSVMGEREITDFLNHLAVDRNVAASTQNQALLALVFLYEHIIKTSVPALNQLKRAKKPSRLLPAFFCHAFAVFRL
jgi:site-specific recombinase XerD